ncbi:MAG: hypothetical protein ACRC7C_10165, partial [Beijerinckiaceae bacterium]
MRLDDVGASRRAVLSTLASGAAAALLSAGGAGAQSSWPSRQIIFLNPFPAGGGTDAFARPLAAQLD